MIDKWASPVAQWWRILLWCRSHRRHGFNPWARKIFWRKAWQPTPVFLPAEPHGQKSLAGYSPWGCKESDRVRQTNTFTIFYYFFTSSMFYIVFIIIYFSDSIIIHYVLCLVSQLCSTLCDLMDCGPPRSSVHGDSPGKNTGVGCHAFLQGISQAQGSNPGLLHCRQILYCLSHQGSPISIISYIKIRLFLNTYIFNFVIY